MERFLERDRSGPHRVRGLDSLSCARMAGVVGDGPRLARELEEVREQQRAISGVLRAVARSAGLPPVLDEVAEECKRLCKGDHASVWLLREGVLQLGAHQGEPAGAEYDREHPHLLDRTSAAGRAAVERRPVQIADVLADSEYTYPGPRFFRAMLGVPIMFEDDLIGVVVVVRREPEPFTDDHVALAQTFADQAAIALMNARLLEAVERQRTELSRFVAPQVADLVSSEDGERLLAGHRAYISSLFCDLRGFTAFAETAAPEELLDVLRDYHAVLGELISAYGGTLEHFAGDGVMVFFNDPLPVDEHELQAIRLALSAQARFAQLSAAWSKRGIELSLGIGIEAGYATLGRIGFEGRFDYGALGPATNLASRLSTHASAGQTLIGRRVFAATEHAVETIAVGGLDLKGFGRPIFAYEVRGLR
jgi:class 3 adenylate cyclase/putative methionine-R-sulfoxide reductase with GAF domain